MIERPRALLAWSSGKDSAFALHVLRQREAVEVIGLLTTINTEFARVAMHAVPAELLDAQAMAVGRLCVDRLLDGLPSGVAPGGENGEFHTFAFDGPAFSSPVPNRVGEIVHRDGFVFADVVLEVGQVAPAVPS